MSSISHEPIHTRRKKWSDELRVREAWASLAISVIWIAVLFDAIFGPNIVSTTPGGTSSSVPSSVVVGLFAFLATWVVARYAFREKQ